MRVRYTGNDWQPGTMYPPGNEPRPVTWEGEIACGFHDEAWGDVFVIWDEKVSEFRKVQMSGCERAP